MFMSGSLGDQRNCLKQKNVSGPLGSNSRCLVVALSCYDFKTRRNAQRTWMGVGDRTGYSRTCNQSMSSVDVSGIPKNAHFRNHDRFSTRLIRNLLTCTFQGFMRLSARLSARCNWKRHSSDQSMCLYTKGHSAPKAHIRTVRRTVLSLTLFDTPALKFTAIWVLHGLFRLKILASRRWSLVFTIFFRPKRCRSFYVLPDTT